MLNSESEMCRTMAETSFLGGIHIRKRKKRVNIYDYIYYKDEKELEIVVVDKSFTEQNFKKYRRNGEKRETQDMTIVEMQCCKGHMNAI